MKQNSLLLAVAIGALGLGLLAGTQFSSEKTVTVPVAESQPIEASDGSPVPPRRFFSRGSGSTLEVNLPDAEGFDNHWYPVAESDPTPVVRRVPDQSNRRDFVALVHADGIVTFTILGPEDF